MRKCLIATLVAALAFLGSAKATTTIIAPTNVSGTVVSTCQVTTTPINFGTVSIPAGGNSTTQVSFIIECTGPATDLLYPDSIGSAQWSGFGRNVSSNGQKLYLTMTADGQPLPIGGLMIVNNGTRQTVTIQAKITPETTFSGSFNENIMVTAVVN